MPDGIFVAVVGPSGAGKDTLLAAAARALGDRPRFHFVRRVVTRPANAASEDHDTLAPGEFEAQAAAGAFCLSWTAHGLNYGLPASALAKFRLGSIVVANISRGTLGNAAAVFGRMAVVEVAASLDVLAHRIATRGREASPAVQERLARAAPLVVPPGCLHTRIENDGALDDAISRFVDTLRGQISD